MSKPAKGPWGRDKYGSVVDADGKEVLFRSLSTLSAGTDDRIAMAEANTDLAAAAPGLLAALETARDYVAGELEYRKQALAGYPDKWRTEEQDLAAIDAAIAKARSQS